METSIIGAIAITLCIAPLVFMYKSRKKNESALLHALKELANSYKSNISTYDVGPSFAIGIDEQNTYVFYTKTDQDQTFDQCVPLGKIKNCYVNVESRSVNKNKGTETVIDKMELVFEPRDKSLAPCKFVFFNSDERFQPNGEKQLLIKWETIINKQLKKSV